MIPSQDREAIQNMSESANPFAPPQAEVRDVPATALEPAGRGARLAAAIVDGVLYMAILFGLDFVLPLHLFERGQEPPLLLLTVLGLSTFLLVQGWPLLQRGQTLGKIALGLRIVRPDGSRVGAGRLLGLRYGVGFVIAVIPVVGNFYALVDSLLIFRESRKCLHDNIADTIVVKA